MPPILTESDFTELHAVAQQVRICELESQLRSVAESHARAERVVRDVLHGAGASLHETLRASVAMTETRGLLAEALRHPDKPKTNVLHFPQQAAEPKGAA